MKKIKKNSFMDMQRASFTLLFFLFAGILGAYFGADSTLIIFACIIGGYMAMNIGANDVANNMGPAVGSKSLSLFWAIVIAFICEAGGAILAGADVVSTVKSGIINQSYFTDSKIFINIMLAALIASALWLHLATFIGAPVSTTHSIVGGILGAGLLAGGASVVKWKVMGSIAASWVISPVLGGLIAGGVLYLIKKTITYKSDKKLASQKMLPFLIALMTFAFAMYLGLKGFKNLVKLNFPTLFITSLSLAVIIYLIMRPIIRHQASKLDNSKESVNSLFAIPLVFGAGFLSFAHGANDVANAIGPLAAINQMLQDGIISSKTSVPFWILIIGGIGISVGLALYGPRLIKTVGEEITDLNKMRAFCVAMSAAITVLIATYLGLPVSSTHIALGSIFGVGFLREYLKHRYEKILFDISARHNSKPELEDFLSRFQNASVPQKKIMLETLKRNKNIDLGKKDKNALKKIYRQQFVKRSAMNKIIASWLITVPASAVCSAFVFYTLGYFKI